MCVFHGPCLHSKFLTSISVSFKPGVVYAGARRGTAVRLAMQNRLPHMCMLPRIRFPIMVASMYTLYTSVVRQSLTINCSLFTSFRYTKLFPETRPYQTYH